MRTGIATIPFNVKKNSFRFLGIDGIPTEPQIPLDNYLLDLVAQSDGKESSVYLKGVEKFIQKIWAEMVRDNWKTLRVRQFVPEKLGVHQMMLYYYKNGKKAISIQTIYKLLLLWKKYCKKTNKDVNQKWDEIYKSDFTFSIHKGLTPTELPKHLSPKLSYLIGWICGDGHMTDYGNHYLIRISEKSLKELYLLQSLFEHLFNIKSPIFRIYEGGHALQFGNKPIFRFLTRVLKIKVGEIPEIINKFDKVNKKHFLAGIFDAEGYVSKSRYRLTISQASLKFLKKVMSLANEIGVVFRGPVTHRTNLGTWYTIRIDGKDGIFRFVNLIGTYHIDKSQRLKKIITNL